MFCGLRYVRATTTSCCLPFFAWPVGGIGHGADCKIWQAGSHNAQPLFGIDIALQCVCTLTWHIH